MLKSLETRIFLEDIPLCYRIERK